MPKHWDVILEVRYATKRDDLPPEIIELLSATYAEMSRMEAEIRKLNAQIRSKEEEHAIRTQEDKS